MTDILGRIALAQTASCTCQTKTHEAKYHDLNCRYRVLEDAIIEIEQGRARLAKLEDDHK